ncbi:hypothetical protein Mapa_017359 [Marchantia paleacea]|nr:hypothetical protein Mapa_017359 [Marchantia paleacea]
MRRLDYFLRIEELCPVLEDVAARPLGDIIRRMDNLEAFDAGSAGMLMTEWAQVAEALTWRGVSNLTELRLTWNAIGTGEGFTLISRVLQVSSKLKCLNIERMGMGEAAGKALGEACNLGDLLVQLKHIASPRALNETSSSLP